MTVPEFTLKAARYAAGEHHPPHAHEELQITVILQGALDERVGGDVERPTPLSIVVKDPGVVHEDRFGPGGAVTAQLSLPRHSLADVLEHPDRAAAWRWMHDPRCSLPFLRLLMRGMKGDRRFGADDDDITDLVAGVTARPSRAVTRPPAWLRDAVHQMREGWRPGLSVREVARAHRVHPVYLARCVRRWYGIGAGELLRRIRLRRAASALTSEGGRVARIAQENGYVDESHFSRDFAGATGLPPARFRRLVAGYIGFADPIA